MSQDYALGRVEDVGHVTHPEQPHHGLDLVVLVWGHEVGAVGGAGWGLGQGRCRTSRWAGQGVARSITAVGGAGWHLPN